MTRQRNAPPDAPLRMLPHSLEAERAVLGSILIDGRRLSAVAGLVMPEDFYAEEGRVLFGRLLQMGAAKIPLNDTALVVEALRKNDEWEAVGGAATLAEIAHATPVSAHAVYYAEIVREKAWRRRLIHALEQMVDRCYDEKYDVLALKQTAARLLQRVVGT